MATEPTGRSSEIREVPPRFCVNGHPLRPPNVAIAHLPCTCAGLSGHRVHTCLTCQATLHDPPHTDDTQSGGRERGR